MKYCQNCKKEVKVVRNTVNIGIADIWNDRCEICNELLDTGFEHIKTFIFDLENNKVTLKDEDEKS